MNNINLPDDFQGFKSQNYSVGLYYSDATKSKKPYIGLGVPMNRMISELNC